MENQRHCPMCGNPVDDYGYCSTCKENVYYLGDRETMINKKEVIVFTNQGKTFKFRNVTNISYKTIGFSFDYEGESTGKKRHIEFFFNSTCGFAVTDM